MNRERIKDTLVPTTSLILAVGTEEFDFNSPGNVVNIQKRNEGFLSKFTYVFLLIVPYFTCYHSIYENDSHYHNGPGRNSSDRLAGRNGQNI